jgi:hypothetical protein
LFGFVFLQSPFTADQLEHEGVICKESTKTLRYNFPPARCWHREASSFAFANIPLLAAVMLKIIHWEDFT